MARVEQEIEEIADPDSIVRLAEVADEVIGFAMAVPSNNELRAVHIKPNPVASGEPCSPKSSGRLLPGPIVSPATCR